MIGIRYQIEDSGFNIRVMEVLPPVVDTPMTLGTTHSKITPEKVAQDVINGLAQEKKKFTLEKFYY